MNRHTEGEEWAAAELRQLRNRRFAPHAWARFIANSFHRAARTRAARPALARQARRWSLVGGATSVALCAVNPRLRRHALGSAGWWVALAAMLDWHLGMVQGPAGECRDRLSPADAVTLTRLWGVPFLEGADEPNSFTVLILGAALTDTLDGPLARQLGPTRLGRDLDRTADLMVMLAAASSARRLGWLNRPVATLLLLRATLPIAVVAGSYFLRDAAPNADEFGSYRLLAPMLTAGLAIAPTAPRVGNTLVAIAAASPLTTATAKISRRLLVFANDRPGSSPAQKASRAHALEPGGWIACANRTARRNQQTTETHDVCHFRASR
ncbi:CDP-alcohol phosphatidyltransferase family protein [Conexibacter sp. DBS9H8]|uniref:CDP-alcohol phosphatidyltransferase family protein n=1 Tax=Conexibacter sp. DBS9H8 TaxID=2937801 RepID=UPI00200BE0AC|nr:CDP-alcohol phosphatidyltransferase family protein [Conexibacter sp. DBS9H8]